jgi:hypothetical protein
VVAVIVGAVFFSPNSANWKLQQTPQKAQISEDSYLYAIPIRFIKSRTFWYSQGTAYPYPSPKRSIIRYQTKTRKLINVIFNLSKGTFI